MEDVVIQEYFKLVDIVDSFDQRLLTIKGWGVTLSLAALGLGFQEQHSGLFLVSAVSSLTFWIIEAAIKRHQMHYYVRMREIEIHRYELFEQKKSEFASPLIEWGRAT